ncbi:MAG: hypothetical protein ABJ308_01815 [Halieaceae bacterium]
MEVFNNREIATLVWLLIALAWCLRHEKIRIGLGNVIRAAFAKPLLKIYALMFSYIITMVYFLYEFGLWGFEQTKSTLVWTFSVALVSLFRHKEIQENPEYFKKSLLDNFNLVIVIEFIVTFYSFHILFELAFIPAVALLAGVHAYSGFDDKYKLVENLLDKFFMALGVFLLIYAGHNIIIGLAGFATMETLTDFYIPPVLSILFLPFVYLISVYSSYERAFIRIGSNAADRKILRYAKWRSIIAFHFRTRLMERWAHSTFFNQLGSYQDVNNTIKRMKKIVAYEKAPEPVPLKDGWCPYEAKEYLKKYGLGTGYYTSIDDDEWFANSDYLDVGDGIIPNSIAYYVSGTRKAAKGLKLKLAIHQPEEEDPAIERFVELSNELLSRALGATIVDDLEKALRGGHAVSGEFENKAITITREDWPDSKTGQYGLEFLILSP